LIRHILFVLFGLLLGSGLFAQEYQFEVFNQDKGLTQQYIYNIIQGKNGRIFLSTENGLVVFDGYNFQAFDKNNGLAENFITQCLVTSQNKIITGHFQEGISLGGRGKFSKLSGEALQGKKISGLIEIESGVIIISTRGDGLYMLKNYTELSKVNEVEEDFINSMAWLGKNMLAIGGNEGLTIFEVDGTTFRKKETIAALKGKTISALVSDGVTDIFAGVKDGGIYWVRKNAAGFKSRSMSRSDLMLADEEYTSFCLDRGRYLYVSLTNGGIRKIPVNENEENEKEHIIIFSTKNGLPTNNIQSLFIDAENNLWVGTYGKGLAKLSDQKFYSLSLLPDLSTEGVLTTAPFNGQIFCGLSKGLAILKRSSSGTQYRLISDSLGLPNAKISALKVFSGNLLAVVNQKEIWKLGPGSKRFQKINVPFKNQSTVINSLNFGPNEWLISSSEGLFVLDQSKGTFSVYSTLSGLPHNSVKYACMGPDNKIWVACPASKITYILNDQVHSFDSVPGFRSFNIHCIEKGLNGNIWIATDGDGLFKYDGEEFLNFKTENGIFSNYCYFVFPDSTGSIWVTHKNSVSRLRNFSAAFRSFSSPKDFDQVEINSYSASVNPGKIIYFGTTEGLLVFDPKYERLDFMEPFCAIRQIFFNDKVFAPSDNITLPYSKYNVKINYLGISHSNPRGVKYKYTLDGLEDSWHEVDYYQRVANYPSLSDGKYTFRLMASNSEGVWTSSEVTFSFEIASPFWKKAWFYIVATILLFGAIYGYVRFKTFQLRENEKALNKIIQEQTAVIRNEKSAVEEVKKILEVKNKDLTDSINYAKRIQNCILPGLEHFVEKTEIFVFYRPRDIVSGDFYYIKDLENKMIVSAVDCTGHGVPGAFTSLVGFTSLNKIITEYNIYDPEKVLLQLHAEILHFFRRNRVDSQDSLIVNEGMDMAFCLFDFDKMEVEFSGADRPLYLIRDKKLHEFKGTFNSIGEAAGRLVQFPKVSVPLKKGDSLFLFSDGFADQFGGPDNRKFGTKRLKDLLISIGDLDAEEQRLKIKTAHKQWKENSSQIDDILLIGVKIK
jgi:serine phosphatase RsbU (regulator of sigma subunit)/ligand-binding sensor domain-containing protein